MYKYNKLPLKIKSLSMKRRQFKHHYKNSFLLRLRFLLIMDLV